MDRSTIFHGKTHSEWLCESLPEVSLRFNGEFPVGFSPRFSNHGMVQWSKALVGGLWWPRWIRRGWDWEQWQQWLRLKISCHKVSIGNQWLMMVNGCYPPIEHIKHLIFGGIIGFLLDKNHYGLRFMFGSFENFLRFRSLLMKEAATMPLQTRPRCSRAMSTSVLDRSRERSVTGTNEIFWDRSK